MVDAGVSTGHLHTQPAAVSTAPSPHPCCTAPSPSSQRTLTVTAPPPLVVQDEFAARSHKKAAAAQAAGKFKDEIAPVSTKVGPNLARVGQGAPGRRKFGFPGDCNASYPLLCGTLAALPSSRCVPALPARLHTYICPSLSAPCATLSSCASLRLGLHPPQHVDPKTGVETPVVVSEDDGIRAGATAEELSRLRAVFKKDGTTTAGNSSQVR